MREKLSIRRRGADIEIDLLFVWNGGGLELDPPVSPTVLSARLYTQRRVATDLGPCKGQLRMNLCIM